VETERSKFVLANIEISGKSSYFCVKFACSTAIGAYLINFAADFYVNRVIELLFHCMNVKQGFNRLISSDLKRTWAIPLNGSV
jgi:hypothetical protein